MGYKLIMTTRVWNERFPEATSACCCCFWEVTGSRGDAGLEKLRVWFSPLLFIPSPCGSCAVTAQRAALMWVVHSQCLTGWIVVVLSTTELEGYNQRKWRVRMSKMSVWMNKIRVSYEQYPGSGIPHLTKHQLIWRVRSLLQRLKISNSSAQRASALAKGGDKYEGF